jgi:uncharacterized protein (TIGR04255 family)
VTGPSREIYPNAPLRYVACEIRFPFNPSVASGAGFAAIHSRVERQLPIAEPGAESTLIIGPQGPLPSPADTRAMRFLSRNRQDALYITSTRALVETTAYRGFVAFVGHIERAVDALAAGPTTVAGIARIGLRYIDEIRVPHVSGLEGWEGFISEHLLAPGALRANEVAPSTIQGVLTYELPEDSAMVMRYGALEGRMVGDAPLRHPRASADSHYFLIDIDSFWTPQPDHLPEFDRDQVLATSDRLHRPIRDAFEGSITERLRDEVLRRDPIAEE